ncbi:D-alanine--D-alanine ligase family protein [Peribacillus alkalitolerans]|uniref:D-alanine--D-alanine ligase family protein n=1 Tax=Peribacillus alkalitolerans TaxID=1550385 RepID=UPI0013D84587|nr:D-alanine--D-alanine ligase [Peribacillus alkalitolerans]
MRIVVLAGGLSDERDVSLASGAQISNALISKNHDVLLLDIYKGLKDVYDFDSAYKKYRKVTYTYNVPKERPNLEVLRKQQNNQKSLIGPNVLEICQDADICFLALHGGIGENGQLQALFDIYGIQYTGSCYEGSLLAMNKKISKELMTFNGIKTPKWDIYNFDKELPEINYPVVVKPNDNGSSIGVIILNNSDETHKALEEIKDISKTILIEEKIEGREFSVGIIGNIALPVIEIIPKQGFFDYQSKYQEGASEEISPANIPDSLAEELQNNALKVHNLLGLKVYSRIDFIVNQDHVIYCIEANSLPGMTQTSLLPQEAHANQISYEDLCELLIKESLKKYS